MNVYPIFLNDLAGRRCVVFGWNHEAERKVRELLDCQADVVVVTPALDFVADGELPFEWVPRDYEPGDLRGAFLAIATETNPEKTAPIWEEAEREKVLFNAMDDVPKCSFVAGSVVRRGRLTLAISTGGAAPALSVRLRQEFERNFGPEYADFLGWMASLRGEMARRYPDFQARRRIWYELVDSDVLDLLAAGDEDAALARVRQISGLSPSTDRACDEVASQRAE